MEYKKKAPQNSRDLDRKWSAYLLAFPFPFLPEEDVEEPPDPVLVLMQRARFLAATSALCWACWTRVLPGLRFGATEVVMAGPV